MPTLQKLQNASIPTMKQEIPHHPYPYCVEDTENRATIPRSAGEIIMAHFVVPRITLSRRRYAPLPFVPNRSDYAAKSEKFMPV